MNIPTCLEKLNITDKEFENFFNFYHSDYSQYGNEVYDDIKVRLVHWKSFIENNFWNNRFYFLWSDYGKYDQIVDLGFSVPYLPLYLRQNNKMEYIPKLLYVDGNETSKTLAEIILVEFNCQKDFVVGDLQKIETWKLINEKIAPKKVLFTSFETIEHLDHPEIFWEQLRNYTGCDMILSLPIGPKIPSHNLYFSNDLQIKEYLSSYLEIQEEMIFDGKTHGSDYCIYTCTARIK